MLVSGGQGIMRLMTYRVSRIACVVHSSCVRCSLFCAPSHMFVLLSLFLCHPRHHDSQANYQQLNSCYFFHHSFLLSQVQPQAKHQPSLHLRSLASLLFFPYQWLVLLPQQTRYRRPQRLFFFPISWPSLIRLFKWLFRLRKDDQNLQSRVQPLAWRQFVIRSILSRHVGGLSAFHIKFLNLK